MAKKTKKAKKEMKGLAAFVDDKNNKENSQVNFVVITQNTPNDFPFYFMGANEAHYFNKMSQVVLFLKNLSVNREVRVFEISAELKTRTKTELDI